MSDIVIEAQGLTKRYGAATAVDDISFAVDARRDLRPARPERRRQDHDHPDAARLDRHHAGEARVLGHDPVREPLAVKRRVGYLPDSVGFYDNLTAARQSALHRAADRASRRRARAAHRAALDRVGLARCRRQAGRHVLARHAPAAGLAEILMKDAQIAILDEPTSGLDPQATLELLDIIRALKLDGVTMLLSSHLLDRVQSVCDRVALFNDGQHRADGHGRRTRPPGARRRLCRRGRGRRAAGFAERLGAHSGRAAASSESGPNAGGCSATAMCVPEAAAAVVAARRPAHATVGR